MQTTAEAASSSVQQLKDKISAVTDYWQHLLNRSNVLRESIQEREKQLNDMSWVERYRPELIGGRGAAEKRKLKALKDAYVSTMESEVGIMKDFASLIHSAEQSLRALESPQVEGATSPTLLYWRDEEGEHSLHTQRLRVA